MVINVYAGDVPARMIEIISPTGVENFFHELSELSWRGRPKWPKWRT
jgi:hypothetical protein